MTHDIYKQLNVPTDVKLKKCAVCGSQSELWQYSDSPKAPISRVVMCTNSEPIGPQEIDDITNKGCLLYMPPIEFYCSTSKQAIEYWNSYMIALEQLRERNGVSVDV